MKIKIVALLILTLLTTCSDPDVTSQKPVVPKLPAVRFYGDSMTAGYGASISENKWTSKLCKKKGWFEINNGTPYETLITASEKTGYTHFFEKYQTSINTRPADGKYIFISYGGNDCAFNFEDYTPELFSTQLQTIITFANSKGWTNDSIVVLTGYFENDASWSADYGGQTFPAATMTRYNSFITAAQTVASNNAGVIFVNPFDTYDVTGLADQVHANDKGHAAIAEYVATLVP